MDGDESQGLRKSVSLTGAAYHVCKPRFRLGFYLLHLKTSMMWPSQNFLLYNGTVIKIKVNEWMNN